MKILYISHLCNDVASGLNWSVPASVNAQAKIDEVLWVDITNAIMDHWKNVPVYHSIYEFGGLLRLNALPRPFNHPDVVVFEGLYFMGYLRFYKELIKHNIPYIIVPRCSLTNLALNNHAWLKKLVAHKLFFNRFINKATAIQYLTMQEANESTLRFHNPFFIIPNGFDFPKEKKKYFSENRIKALFIGRLDIFQKGLDILLNAVEDMADELEKGNFHLDIYGPQQYDYKVIKSLIIEKNLSSIVSLHGEISGDAKKLVILNADLFIMTSRFEGHPMGLIEALSYGLPCLVSIGSNMFEEIQKYDAGWTCDGDVESVKKALRQVVVEQNCLWNKSENALKLSSRYDWDDLARMFHNNIKTFL